jgi:hypothetical protein
MAAELLCQTGNCTWLNEKVPSTREGWKSRCPEIAHLMMEKNPEMDLQPGECPAEVAYVHVNASFASTSELGGVR